VGKQKTLLIISLLIFAACTNEQAAISDHKNDPEATNAEATESLEQAQLPPKNSDLSSEGQQNTKTSTRKTVKNQDKPNPLPEQKPLPSHPMAIERLRSREYLASDFEIEEKLANGTNFERLVVSYKSEGLKIYGLLTIPLAEMPENGFPAILFIHGYIPPDVYSTINSYPTYQARLARAGFVTFKPDLRGHGDSEGEPESAHFSEKYVIDTLYALGYLQNYPEVNPERIGYWGHSNGGEIGLRVAVVTDEIKAYSLWAGVVGSFEDLFETYNPQIDFLQDLDRPLINNNSLPSENPKFWSLIDPFFHLKKITAPIELQHATGDKSVPVELSQSLKEALEEVGKSVEYWEYQGDDHNISGNVNTAFRRSIEFYEKHL
jgi:dipeptidyl aminopeptidase/acylaminoacyl peptidase